MFHFFLMLMSLQTTILLSDFSNPTESNNWVILNDGVMGGMSKGECVLTSEGNAIFKGNVSLENNGGFTSIRKSFKTKDITGVTKVFIRLKGDQKGYQFRVKKELADRHSYKYEFKTSGEWEIIEIELNKMSPTYRGYRPDMPDFTAESLSEICFLIGNKKKESFALVMDRIWME